ncbi:MULTISPECIES: alpha/beta fold hydrolase [Asticcacaulis]|uniref:alpha/beta fold hydrolase n=1 Tax=Asticcacaulis TaxID=76890 RepID=UPI001AE23885|nr:MULTISPECIES: alpha/beta hydrolase [Asticcacaulis]MBP2158874.1 pimeloyl-ACP methyl ester carboxylesterase [Asticcacaulis solisilvae]MDR6799919.1 pimeloyl-ACP methyl ester carboxylesterase [Asticcacaulis sp. BE141]
MAKVTSKDGTHIAFDRAGNGPALILVGGALSDHSGSAPLAKLLAPHFTVFSYDRRGRGGSGDKAPYAVEREIEDIDALITEAGGAAFVHGHSSGAVLALDAATKLPARIRKLSVYEPPFITDDSRSLPPEGYDRKISELVANNRRADAVEYFMTAVVGAPAPAVAEMRKSPMWKGMEGLAHTLPYDIAVLDGRMSGKSLTKAEWEGLSVPALVMDGGASPPWIRNSAVALAKALPNAQHKTLAGQQHNAAPDVVAAELVKFFS